MYLDYETQTELASFFIASLSLKKTFLQLSDLNIRPDIRRFLLLDVMNAGPEGDEEPRTKNVLHDFFQKRNTSRRHNIRLSLIGTNN
jgi:hypothetical protein